MTLTKNKNKALTNQGSLDQAVKQLDEMRREYDTLTSNIEDLNVLLVEYVIDGKDTTQHSDQIRKAELRQQAISQAIPVIQAKVDELRKAVRQEECQQAIIDLEPIAQQAEEEFIDGIVFLFSAYQAIERYNQTAGQGLKMVSKYDLEKPLSLRNFMFGNIIRQALWPVLQQIERSGRFEYLGLPEVKDLARVGIPVPTNTVGIREPNQVSVGIYRDANFRNVWLQKDQPYRFVDYEGNRT